ncbi:MAG: NADH-quinone oxidoreductase subunit J [Caldilineaceae bacterium]|nr:NADH-quinone oxidoreductase subunit J [Caldilineaceae bacterium]MCB0095887.1 NADH-quinone oxidoreductase subunit J [Caldilineaceae bacterium]MCB0138454.1 NADH-quinone oxidoreductase subunit J [Caldilineaceae bacterium]MCB9156807.1 NADH-quinone oxidoreductase subunit J [Caldilineaceae bacterium]
MPANLDELIAQLPTFQQFIFVQVALFTAVMALLVVLARNLFHNALALVGALFGVAGLYALLEAEFLAVSQVLIYVGGISTLITFAIMLTRGMMFGDTSPNNRQAGTAAIVIGTMFSVMVGFLLQVPWQEAYVELGDGQAIIANLGRLFVNEYLIPFEMMALLLLVVLAGAIMLARDHMIE